MMMRQRTLVVLALAATLLTAPLAAQSKGKGKAHGKGRSQGSSQSAAPYAPGHGGVPPGLAKRNTLPPGLAKTFGRPLASRERVYVAFDPRRSDRAWFLIEDRWVERRGFAPALRLEVRRSLSLPAIPLPPVPPPVARLHVVLFGS